MIAKRSRRQRGLSLVESLIAFAVSMAGMAALLCAESGLHLHTDLTRQRAEAVRQAQQEIEQVRAFASLGELRSMPTAVAATAGGGSARFMIERRVEESPMPGAWAVGVDVQWKDRQGQPAGVALRSMLAALDPGLSGKVVTQNSTGTGQAPKGRSPWIPLPATDLGDGRSRFIPPGSGGIAWLFDNASGQVTSICGVTDEGGGGSAGRCVSATGLLVSGHVGFATGATATLQDAARPTSPALDLDLQLRLLQGEAACYDDGPPGTGSTSIGATSMGSTNIGFYCLVALAPGQPRWSGRLDLVPLGWTLGHDAQSFRVCRYSSDDDGVPGLSNSEHPLDYRDVDTPLAHQNFLVIRGDHACPADDGSGRAVNASTVEQAPQPQSAPFS